MLLMSVGLTGANALSLHTALDGSAFTETVPAIVEGVKLYRKLFCI